MLKHVRGAHRRTLAVVATTALTFTLAGTGADASPVVSTTAIGCSALSMSHKTLASPALARLERLFRLADTWLATAAVGRADTKGVCANQAKVAAAVSKMPRARSFDELNADFNATTNALGDWYTEVKGLLRAPAAPATSPATTGACFNSVCVPSDTITIGGAPDPSQVTLEAEQLVAPVIDATRGILATVGELAHVNFNLPIHVMAIMPASLPVDQPTIRQNEYGPGPADDTQVMANATDSLSSVGGASMAHGTNTCDNYPYDVGSIDNQGRPGPHDTQGDSQNSTVHGYDNGGAYLIHDYTESGDGASIGGNTDSQDGDAQIGFAATFVGGQPNEIADVQVTMPMYWAGDAHAGSNTPLGAGYIPYLGSVLGSFAGKSTSSVKVDITADMFNDGVMLTSYPVFDPPELVGDNGTGGNAAGYYGSYTYKANIPFSGTPHTFGSVLHYHAHLTDSPSSAADVLADADFAVRDIQGQINTAMIRWHYIFNPGWPGSWVDCT
jgi:hypothetical protein